MNYGLLAPEEQEYLKGTAMTSGLLSALAGAAGSAGRPWGQVIGNALSGGLQGYQGTFANAEQSKLAQQRLAQQQQEYDIRNQEYQMRAAEAKRKQEQQARQQQMLPQIAQKFNIDPQMLEMYPDVAQELIKRQIIPQAPELGSVSPDKFTPESLAKFRQSNNYADLVPVADKGSVPSAIQEYNLAKEQGFKGTFFDFQAALKRAGASSTTVSYGAPVSGVDANGNPIFFQPSKDGGAPAIIPGVAPAPTIKQPTEAQAKAGTFHSQMVNAGKTLNDLEAEGYDPSSLGTQVSTSAATGLGNLVVSPQSQKARQAQNQWAESFLRVKTGAAATKEEVKMNVETFFPQPGDSAAVIEQKRQARAQAEQDVLNMTQNPNNIIPKESASNKKQSKPKSKQITLDDGSKVLGELRSDGFYYVKKGGKTFRVEE